MLLVVKTPSDSNDSMPLCEADPWVGIQHGRNVGTIMFLLARDIRWIIFETLFEQTGSVLNK